MSPLRLDFKSKIHWKHAISIQSWIRSEYHAELPPGIAYLFRYRNLNKFITSMLSKFRLFCFLNVYNNIQFSLLYHLNCEKILYCFSFCVKIWAVFHFDIFWKLVETSLPKFGCRAKGTCVFEGVKTIAYPWPT